MNQYEAMRRFDIFAYQFRQFREQEGANEFLAIHNFNRNPAYAALPAFIAYKRRAGLLGLRREWVIALPLPERETVQLHWLMLEIRRALEAAGLLADGEGVDNRPYFVFMPDKKYADTVLLAYDSGEKIPDAKTPSTYKVPYTFSDRAAATRMLRLLDELGYKAALD